MNYFTKRTLRKTTSVEKLTDNQQPPTDDSRLRERRNLKPGEIRKALATPYRYHSLKQYGNAPDKDSRHLNIRLISFDHSATAENQILLNLDHVAASKLSQFETYDAVS